MGTLPYRVFAESTKLYELDIIQICQEYKAEGVLDHKGEVITNVSTLSVLVLRILFLWIDEV